MKMEETTMLKRLAIRVAIPLAALAIFLFQAPSAFACGGLIAPDGDVGPGHGIWLRSSAFKTLPGATARVAISNLPVASGMEAEFSLPTNNP